MNDPLAMINRGETIVNPSDRRARYKLIASPYILKGVYKILARSRGKKGAH
jgi:hypothetical protein